MVHRPELDAALKQTICSMGVDASTPASDGTDGAAASFGNGNSMGWRFNKGVSLVQSRLVSCRGATHFPFVIRHRCHSLGQLGRDTFHASLLFLPDGHLGVARSLSLIAETTLLSSITE